jgi:DNA (cytosine-5)-methyltransferase 1
MGRNDDIWSMNTQNQEQVKDRKPRLLDLFCGAGGCGVGYSRAGFDVVGVDIAPQPRYPFEFHQADALEFLAEHGREFDAIHASPPCQAYSLSKNNGAVRDAPRLIPSVREALSLVERPWVIENVVGAPLFFAVELCGASFGLGIPGFDLPRHRLFECSHLILAPPCQHRRGKTIGVYGHGTNRWHREKMGRNLKEREKAEAMGIDWMNRFELSQAVPPAYTQWIGERLIGTV